MSPSPRPGPSTQTVGEPGPRAPGGAPAGPSAPMEHRQILQVLSGLLLGMFVAILSSTIVSNALPVILPDLGGNQAGYTWVITASLLATTIATPVWGKLADLYSKKTLVQTSLVIFTVASAVAGLSVNVGMLIVCRVFQGLGAGGLTALAQVVIAAMIPPRERGRYSGYIGATFALATVSGPLIGGVLTEHLTWHATFYATVPFAIVAFVVLQRTLDLPVAHRTVVLDYWGVLLLAAGTSGLLIWVSLAGKSFAWLSWPSALMIGGSVVLLVVMVLVERRAVEPIIPLRLFRERTTVLAAIAALFTGVGLFSATIYLSQYFQLARGATPTMSGIYTLPLILGLAGASTVSGRVITRTGRWKRWLVLGATLLTGGSALMATVAADSPYWYVAAWMAMIGVGVGMMLQNLVLAVQNLVAARDLGTASSFIAFTRSLGGAVGVSALGAVLGHQVTAHVRSGLAAAGIPAHGDVALAGGGVPDLSTIPEPVRTIVKTAYGDGVADIFLVSAPCALVALVLVLFIKEQALRTTQLTDDPEPATSKG